VHDQHAKPRDSAETEATVHGVFDREPACARLRSIAAGFYFKGFFRFNPATSTWTLMNSPNTRPGPRHMHGLAATPDGLIYCFAGYAIENFKGCKHVHGMIMCGRAYHLLRLERNRPEWGSRVLHCFFLSPENFLRCSGAAASSRFRFEPDKSLLNPIYSSNLDFEAPLALGFPLGYRDCYDTSPQS
jgi:hypothetical protein